jgi:hypothetical protein
MLGVFKQTVNACSTSCSCFQFSGSVQAIYTFCSCFQFSCSVEAILCVVFSSLVLCKLYIHSVCCFQFSGSVQAIYTFCSCCQFSVSVQAIYIYIYIYIYILFLLPVLWLCASYIYIHSVLVASSLALCKLVHHALVTNDPRVHGIDVQGDLVFTPSPVSHGVKTRSKAAQCK